jgi:hypothetical protein
MKYSKLPYKNAANYKKFGLIIIKSIVKIITDTSIIQLIDFLRCNFSSLVFKYVINIADNLKLLYQIAGFLCKYGRVFALIGCFSLTMVVITGRTIG